MGILGSLLYPDNPKLAQELNDEQTRLEQTNSLHNDLVNSYRVVGESVKTFDAYLMSLLVMQYHLAYTREDLSNLPDVDLPQLSESFADKIESAALDAVTAKMAFDGFKAIKTRVGNLFKEGGILRRGAAQGEESVGAELGAEVDTVAVRTSVLRTGNIEVLTTSKTGGELKGLSEELGGEARAVSETLEAAKAEGEIGPQLEEASTLAEDGAMAAEAGTEAAEASGAAGLLSGASALLGPALLVVTAVTEVISAIHAGQEHGKLVEAEKRMKDLQAQSDKSLGDLKAVFKALLKAGRADIDAYNALLPLLKAIEAAAGFDRTFSSDGLQMYIDGLAGITVDRPGGVQGYEAAALQNLRDATDFIRGHALHDATMTDVISKIKSRMRARGLTTMDDDDPFLEELADVEGLDLATVQTYNRFRIAVAEQGAALLPYHEEIVKRTAPGSPRLSVPAKLAFGNTDGAFDPRPANFTLPAVGVPASL